MNSKSTGRGGARKGAGRPKRVNIALPKGLAQELLASPDIRDRWQRLRDTNDDWLRFRVEQYIWDRAEGKPTIIVAQEPDKPPADVTFGSLPMSASTDKPGSAGKPN